jgi:hypothetical protein
MFLANTCYADLHSNTKLRNSGCWCVGSQDKVEILIPLHQYMCIDLLAWCQWV